MQVGTFVLRALLGRGDEALSDGTGEHGDEPDPHEHHDDGDDLVDELYAYYERTGPMLSNVLRDAELVDFARDAVAPLDAYLEEAAEILTIGRQVRGRRRQLLGGALRHALAFSTWRSLSTDGIGRSDAVKLMAALVEVAATQQHAATRL